MSSDPAHAEALPPEAVVAFLRANPRFLAEQPDLYRRLAPPIRVHGEPLADHMAAMLRAERSHAAALAERADGVVAAGRAAAGLAARVHEAVVALIAASDAYEFTTVELPSLLVVDAASLASETPQGSMRPLPAGAVRHLLGNRAVVFRDDGEDAGLLHGEAAALARHDALVRMPCRAGPTVLALAARDRLALDPAQGTGALAFLGRALAAALER